MKKIAIAVTGASGSIYAKLLMDKLLSLKDQIDEILGTDFLDTDDIIMGIYTGGENIQIIVKDESLIGLLID